MSSPNAPGTPAHDVYALGRHQSNPTVTGHGEGGPSSPRTIVGYGFWIYLLSDIVMFSAFFAAYAVLADEHAGGPGQRELFGQGRVALETAVLLLSSFTCGMASAAADRKAIMWTQGWQLATGILGAAFLALEVQEFAIMASEGAGPQRSAFLSAFFALVGLHGLHIAVGLLWLGTMMAQLGAKGFQPTVLRRMMCFNLFWHALDIIWVGLFTIVYLIGIT
ncbi:cytochrome (ubi)quinol oxidase subunit III [Novosphingobium resinovorum]|uniref:cytochrome (ubi)quinol oxidase subunit III n=1 Tax=Novosphingobium TaxID=165696 RepID=UPI001B3C8A02|nr:MULTISPECIES: cytochrome (ubi)quinol oxidase subunit III [Novosphingobium]MBF7013850.1 cytochrome (ubi)quinol oxidase subunit III [Novosphingobium sp. HR1a]WJM25995.1 cytochrome (ubi)quinol oxidase subunit III [Novosphingobium resinovorum]